MQCHSRALTFHLFVAITGVVMSLCALFPARLCAQENAPKERLRLFSQALAARFQQSNPIWVRFQFEKFDSAELLTALNRRKQASDLRYKAQAEYARKGTKTRSWWRYDDPTMRSWLGEDFILYNGEISIRLSNQENVFLISKAPAQGRVPELPTYVSAEDPLRDFLASWEAGQEELTNVTVKEEQQDGHDPVLHFGWTGRKSQWSGHCWVVPSKNWMIRKLEQRAPPGRLVIVHEIDEYITSDGLYYPKRARRTSFYDNGRVESRTDIDVESVETQASRIPDSLFQFELPKGSQLWDEDLKVMVRDTELTESHLAEVIRRLGPPRSPWVTWMWASLSVGVLALAGWVLLRIWRRRRVSSQ